MEALPVVLLAIRTALKEDTSSTTAEMVYGTTRSSVYLLHLPRPLNNNSQVSNTLSTAT